ncbi:MAG: hypothetical protein LQ340_004365 [Diploschistes diacapsis]|nr:MAG: hypothetical protein LQ340_004365 [Diploschistes diacapsis]
MVERSSSHKSDGRQSSTGHSAHSTRLNSLAFDSRSPALENQANTGPPPGYLLLGPLPCIMRCWLDDNFSNDALLYAAICTGSFTSMISSRLARRHGIIKQIPDREGGSVTLQVFFPEATVQQASSRPLNLIPQVPSISIDFEIVDLPQDLYSLQVVIGSDILRSKSAELSFSQDRMVIFDDERNKLAVPLVRPENPSVFRSLRTVPLSNVHLPTDSRSSGLTNDPRPNSASSDNAAQAQAQQTQQPEAYAGTESRNDEQNTKTLPGNEIVKAPLTIASKRGESPIQDAAAGSGPTTARRIDDSQSREFANGAGTSTPMKETQAGMWGSWRKDSNQHPSSESTFSSVASSSNYQRPGRGKGMKVLKPARSATSRSISSTQTSSTVEQSPLRWQDPPPLRSAGLNTAETPEARTPDSPGRSFSNEPRASFSSIGKAKTANPVGGASAFGWLNSGHK